MTPPGAARPRPRLKSQQVPDAPQHRHGRSRSVRAAEPFLTLQPASLRPARFWERPRSPATSVRTARRSGRSEVSAELSSRDECESTRRSGEAQNAVTPRRELRFLRRTGDSGPNRVEIDIDAARQKRRLIEKRLRFEAAGPKSAGRARPRDWPLGRPIRTSTS